MSNQPQPADGLSRSVTSLTILQKIGLGVCAVSVIGAAIFDGHNDMNNVLATVNLAILGLALTRAGSR